MCTSCKVFVYNSRCICCSRRKRHWVIGRVILVQIYAVDSTADVVYTCCGEHSVCSVSRDRHLRTVRNAIKAQRRICWCFIIRLNGKALTWVFVYARYVSCSIGRSKANVIISCVVILCIITHVYHC